MLKNSDMYPLSVTLVLALLYKSCIHLIIESLTLNVFSVFQRKLWSKLSEALLKAEKKINPGSSVLFAVSIISEINRTFSPIYLPLMNPVCSSFISIVITFFTLFAMHLADFFSQRSIRILFTTYL